MSLVICKTIDNKIFIESDSRITDINEAKRESLYGVLKNVILYPQLSIAFAGSIYLAEKAIKELYECKNLKLTKVFEILLRYNLQENNVEFIICSLDNNNPRIYKVSNGKIDSNSSSAWIGDLNGFNNFQLNYHQLNKSGKSEFDSLRGAFDKVIDNSEIQTIGDFHVSTITEIGPAGHKFFRYFEKFILNLGRSQTLSLKPIEADINQGEIQSQSFNINWGSAEDGSYGVFYFVSVTPYLNAIAYYFAHGNYGVLFCPKINFEGIIIKNRDPMDFLKYVYEAYKILLRGFLLMNDKSGIQLVDMRTQLGLSE